MLAGPRGGASQNFYCEACGQGWNALGGALGLGMVFEVEALGPTNPETLAMYQERRQHRETLERMGLSAGEIEEVLDFISIGVPPPGLLQDREEEEGDHEPV